MLERLVKRLQHPASHIYIHLDAKANINDFEYLKTYKNVWLVSKNIKTEWGNFSLVQATLNGFEHILNTSINYTHINLLSGQDYPLKSIEHITQFFFANPNKTYLSALAIDEGQWDDGIARLQKYSFGDYSFPGKYRLHNLVNKILPARKIPGNLKPYGRSQWFTMNVACAKYCVDYIKKHPRLKRFFRMTWAADEVFFQIILCNSELMTELVNDNLRFIDQYGMYRPAIFRSVDVPKLLSSGKFFARKFDDDLDNEVFDLIDQAQ